MKRYFLGTLAVLLAVVFSSFSPDTSQSKPNTLQQFGFWYYANGPLVGQAIHENSSVLLDKQSMTIDDATDCPDNSGDPCVIGYATQLTPGNPIPSNVTRDGLVLEN